jgi:hypothetical protein
VSCPERAANSSVRWLSYESNAMNVNCNEAKPKNKPPKRPPGIWACPPYNGTLGKRRYATMHPIVAVLTSAATTASHLPGHGAWVTS